MRPAIPLLLLVVLAAACASGAAGEASAWGAQWEGLPGTRRLADVPSDPRFRDLLLTAYPTPRRAEYGDVLLPLEGALRVEETTESVDARLRASGLEIGWRELPPEGYVLATSFEEGRTVVVTAARDLQGRAWADLALAQITRVVDGRPYVRACRILDAPVFPLRGSKRPRAWEKRYRANFAWEARPDGDHAGRILAASSSPGDPLDATAAGVERVLAEWREAHARGARRFCVEFDDVEFGLTPEARERHGDYATALCWMMASLRAGLESIDRDAVLLYLPQTYWWGDPRLPAFADAIRGAGGLPPDAGLVMTGPEIVSDAIDEIGLAAARVQFGLVATPALIYDNLGREGDWGPLAGRDPRLRTQCDGVFGERGTPVNRLTRLDWLWNPHDYDAERSWRRALLEIAGPGGFDALEKVCTAFRRRVPREEAAPLVQRFWNLEGPEEGALPRREVAALLRDDLRVLEPRGGRPRATTRRSP